MGRKPHDHAVIRYSMSVMTKEGIRYGTLIPIKADEIDINPGIFRSIFVDEIKNEGDNFGTKILLVVHN